MSKERNASNSESPFKPGVEVAICGRRFGGGSWSKGKVGKVYATGNFVLEGDTQQYRPHEPWDDKEWSATSAARGYGGDARIYLLTPKYEEQIATQNRVREGLDAVYVLYGIRGEKSAAAFFTPEVVDQLKLLAAKAREIKQ